MWYNEPSGRGEPEKRRSLVSLVADSAERQVGLRSRQPISESSTVTEATPVPRIFETSVHTLPRSTVPVPFVQKKARLAQIGQRKLAAITLHDPISGVVLPFPSRHLRVPLSGGADYTSFAQGERVLPRSEVRRKLGIMSPPSGEN